jgi:hypothetical protein
VEINLDEIRARNLIEYGVGKSHLDLLRSIYPERSHFIFELIQNASDVNASQVEFSLHSDHLEFSHDGRAFSARDVEAISRIAEGTKKDDSTKIGKFGIGFKAVYNYTTRPEIYSQDFSFCIQDYVRPYEIPPKQLDADRTLFIFPFNRMDFAQEKIVEEISKALVELDARSLIFLNSIRSVKWRLPGNRSGELRKAVLSHHVLDNENRSNSSASASIDYYVSSIGRYGKQAEQWRVFSMQAPLDAALSARVEIAFLEQSSSAGSEICAVKPSLLHVCFPTHKKVPVGYILNAPFLTTPSRDNLDNNSHDQNVHFIRASVDLLRVALLQFKKEKLINGGTLSTLAIDRREFPSGDIFRPIFDKTRQVLLEETILPTLSGGNAPARLLLIPSNNEIRNLFGRDEISLLFKLGEGADWLSPSIADKKELSDYLTNDLGIRKITLEDILELIDERYLSKKSDDWIIRFYGFCNKQDATIIRKLRTLPVVRLDDDSHVNAVGPTGKLNAYFPMKGVSGLPNVKAELLKDKDAKAFLQQLGITEPDDLYDTLTSLIPELSANGGILLDEEVYKENLRKIASAFRQADRNQTNLLLSKLKDICWLRGRHGDLRSSSLLRPTDLYSPNDRLLNYFRTAENVWFPELTSDSQEVLPHLASMGLLQYPRFVRAQKHALTEAELQNIEPDARKRGQPMDFEMEGLQEFLLRFSNEVPPKRANYSRILWLILCDITNVSDPPFAEVPREFRSRTINERAKPKWIKQLQALAWLPDAQGKLHPPSDLSASELPPEFTRVKKLAVMLEMKDVVLEALARQCGLSAELLDFVRLNADRITELMHSSSDAASRAMPPEPSMPKEKKKKRKE